LAEFASAVDAVQCAVDIQQVLKTKNADLPTERRMKFRIGINVGDIIVEGPQIYGDGVNIAARLEALAEGGGICISGTVYDQIENKLTLSYESLGEQAVKNIAKPVRVYRIQNEAEAPPPEQARGEGTSPLLPLPDKPSIVVLPFMNMSQDPNQEYFSDGITEDITTDLSKISSLFVISRNSAFTYKGKAVKMPAISRELGVRYVLEGSVRRASERVRIAAQLIDAITDHHLWAERYDRPLTDIFALQDEIVQKIVTTLKLQLTLWEQGLLVRKRTDNLEAYDHFLRGGASLFRAIDETKQEANAQAQQMYEKALALDPSYADAYAGLSFTYYIDWLYLWNPTPQALEQLGELARKAIELDDSLSLGHLALSWGYLTKRQHEHAIVEAERAIALAPNSAEGYRTLGIHLVWAGQAEEGFRAIEKAIRLNPRHGPLYLVNLGWAYLEAGRYEEALVPLKRVLPLLPNSQPLYWNFAVCYAELGRDEEALAAGAEILRLLPNFSLDLFQVLHLYKDPAMLERTLTALRKAGLK
jgi:adenylate cyclase